MRSHFKETPLLRGVFFRLNNYTVIAHPALVGIEVAHFEQRLYTVLMRVVSTESVVIKAEQIRLVRRLDSKKWQVHYKLDGIKTWFRRSADTADVQEEIGRAHV